MTKRPRLKVSMILVIISMFMLTTIIPAFADGGLTLDKKLEKKGVPAELINSMSTEMKEDIVKNTISFVGYSKKTFTETNGQDTSKKGDVIMYGTIPAANMNQYIQVYKTDNSSDNRERYTIYENFEWLNLPLARFTDPFGVAWSDLWRAVPNTSLYRFYYDLPGLGVQTIQDTALAYTNANGVGWNADLMLDATVVLYGWGRITIESKTIGSITGSDQLTGNYAHVYGVGSIGLAFGPISVGYSGTAAADTQGIFMNFNY